MGVDVGTSLSKVVVSVAGRRLAVPFRAPGGEDGAYLLPTAVSEMDDGECRLGLHDGAVQCYDDIKKPLIDGRTDERVRLPLVAFMALLFHRVRKEIHESHGGLLRRHVDWLVNLGVPTESYGDGDGEVTDIVGAYRCSAETAWDLAEKMQTDGGNERPLTLDRCRQAMISGAEKGSGRIGLFPELVPQVASYVKSKQRQEGVHVLVDVGGGTLDVTVFQVVHSKFESKGVPVWARKVHPLGTRYLMDHISKGFSRGLTLSPFEHLPSNTEIAEAVGVPPEELIDKVMPPFQHRVKRAVGEKIREAGKTYSLRWPGRMFLVGGGAFIELYRDVAEEFRTMDWKYVVRLVPLPRPDDLEAPEIADAHWHRLAVAYGLSFDPLDIVDIKPPGEPIPPRYWQPPDVPPQW